MWLHFATIALWCNGNTADFGSVIRGSSPCGATTTPKTIGVSSVVVGLICDSSSIGRALASQAKGCGIVLRLSLQLKNGVVAEWYCRELEAV